MRLIYCGGVSPVVLPDGRKVATGDTFDASEELAARLLRMGDDHFTAATAADSDAGEPGEEV